MDVTEPQLHRYICLLAPFALTDGDPGRMLELIDATELAKTALVAGPAIDQTHEPHRRSQPSVASLLSQKN